jgi:hypothetical protein
MAFAANLSNAGFLSYPQLALAYQGGTLAAKVAAFATAVNPIFRDDRPNDRPIGNWLVFIDSVVPFLPPTDVAGLNQVVEYVGRMCLAGFVAINSGLISPTQANDLLAAWNAAFGT